MKGTIVNAAAVVAGSMVGILLKRGMSERYQQTVMQGLGLTVLLIREEMALKKQNILVVIFSLVLGGLGGEWVGIDKGLQYIADKLTARLGARYGQVGQGFIVSSLVYCVGAMAIVGSIQDGLTGDASTLYTKALLDGVSSVVFASTMGIGVAFSGVSILVYQGLITLLASQASSMLSDSVIREMTAVGGLLIMAIGLMIMDIKKLNVANLLPAIPVAAVLTILWS